MGVQNLLNSKFAVRFSILIGKYLPQAAGYKFAQFIGRLLSSFQNLEINRHIRINQYVVNGETSTQRELVELSRRVLTHAGECYYDLYHFIDEPEKLEELVPLTNPMREFIRLSQQKQGFVVVAPHLSNFDLVVSRLVTEGFQGKVLSYPNPGSGYQLQNRIRKSYGLDVIPLGDPAVEALIVDHLKNGGVMATAVDRPLPDRKKRHFVRFFGRPSPLPVGYVSTALAADVPIIAVTAIQEPDGTYGFRHSGLIDLEKYGNKLDNIFSNAEMVLRRIEEYIKLAPDQWLMYYPVWPDLLDEGL
jgi:phosphatidylinositol dimannoside acyltransferase